MLALVVYGCIHTCMYVLCLMPGCQPKRLQKIVLFFRRLLTKIASNVNGDKNLWLGMWVLQYDFI